MNETSRLGEAAIAILIGVVVAVFGGIGTAMAWFRGTRKDIVEDMTQLKTDIKSFEDKIRRNEAEMAGLTTSYGYILSAIQRIERLHEKNNDAIDEKLEILLEMRRRQQP